MYVLFGKQVLSPQDQESARREGAVKLDRAQVVGLVTKWSI